MRGKLSFRQGHFATSPATLIVCWLSINYVLSSKRPLKILYSPHTFCCGLPTSHISCRTRQSLVLKSCGVGSLFKRPHNCSKCQIFKLFDQTQCGFRSGFRQNRKQRVSEQRIILGCSAKKGPPESGLTSEGARPGLLVIYARKKRFVT